MKTKERKKKKERNKQTNKQTNFLGISSWLGISKEPGQTARMCMLAWLYTCGKADPFRFQLDKG